MLLKISGEALQGGMGFGVDPQVCPCQVAAKAYCDSLNNPVPASLTPPCLQVLRFVAREVAAVMMKGVQVAIVVGGGNYFRGANAWDGLERSTADYIGSAACMHPFNTALQALLSAMCSSFARSLHPCSR